MYMGMVWTRLCKVNFSGLPYTTIGTTSIVCMHTLPSPSKIQRHTYHENEIEKCNCHYFLCLNDI